MRKIKDMLRMHRLGGVASCGQLGSRGAAGDCGTLETAEIVFDQSDSLGGAGTIP
jgi:hypothetical protein